MELGDVMKLLPRMPLSVAIIAAISGCTADVETTEDGTKIEIEAPQVEVGDEPVNLDPRTDEDIDIDTPAPGDT
jgi:hypothetical protein